jgi:ABC-2 type transport system ATP-binding protein
MNTEAIVVEKLTRGYGGPPVLRGLDFQVSKGSIYGFLGRNGSGKTTALKTLAGLIRPESGEVRVLDGDPWTFGAAERQRVGYLSEKQSLPPMSRVSKLVRFCAQLYPAWDHSLCDGLLNRFQIPQKSRVAKLSLGQQRLLAFVLALAPRPDVLLLDEPAANLDVVARREFLDQILELIRDGEKAVLFSTHILSDVERVADRVGILSDGALVVDESLDDLKESVRQLRFFGFQGPPPAEIPGALRVKRERDELLAVIRLDGPDAAAQLATRLGCQVEDNPLSLEDLFIELTRNSR